MGMSWSSKKSHISVAGTELAREKLLPLRIKSLRTPFLETHCTHPDLGIRYLKGSPPLGG